MWAWYLEELRLKKYFDVVGEGEPLRIMHAIWWQPTRSSFSSHPYLEHQPSHRVHSSLFQRMVCFGVEVLLPELLPHWPTQLSHWPISRCSTTELTLPRYHFTPLLSSYHVFSPVIKERLILQKSAKMVPYSCRPLLLPYGTEALYYSHICISSYFRLFASVGFVLWFTEVLCAAPRPGNPIEQEVCLS